MSDAICRVTIRGRVQGVGFRYWVEQQAMRHDLAGWVRNLGDGSVEALFSGPAEVVATMIASCRRGPASASVDAVEEQAGNPHGLKLRRAGERFSVLPTL